MIFLISSKREADLIVEVAHPNISVSHGVSFLQHADYMVCNHIV